MKNIIKGLAAVMAFSTIFMTGCGSNTSDSAQQTAQEATTAQVQDAEPAAEPVELTILAAASLTDVCNEIKTKYEAENLGTTLTFSYGSSGALQTQIEEGAPADIFMSAATKQMTALDEEGLMVTDSITNLLENKVVLIVPKDSKAGITSFEDVATDKVSMIGLGDPASVPVGQYSEEIFTTLGILDEVKAKANYGTDVRSVLSWVETSAVECGVVYATDASVSENVTVICAAPDGSCKQVIYPVGIVKASTNQDAAAAFVAYLQTDEIKALFESYGFSALN
jgi:molybdate transport system substrate-binding protein